MAVIRFEKDGSVAIAPSRMFKAFVLDSHNLFPKLFPQKFKSIVYEQGDGGEAGSIKVMYFTTEGNNKKQTYAKQRVDALDKEKFSCKFTVFEQDNALDIIQSVVHEIKFEASGDDGGSICKTCTEYHVIMGDVDSKLEEELKGTVDGGMTMFKIVEAHLLANPDLYA